MLSKLKCLILIRWKDEGKWPLLGALKHMVSQLELIEPIYFKGPVGNKLTSLSKNLSEFYAPLLALMRRKRFDVVISWSMRTGVCYGILKHIFHMQRLPLHIIQDFHVDLSQTRWFYRFRLFLLKLAIPGIDYFFCTSTEEEEIYSQMFNIPREHIIFLPLVESSSTFKEPSRPPKDYIFSFGKSDRDYDTLVRAAASLNIKTYILSNKYHPKMPVPENVTIIREHISGKELFDWIASGRVVVLSVKDYRVSAAQISMLEVMALARPLVITENMATKEYAVHKQTAMFFEAGNDRDLASCIQYLWNNREAAEQMGYQARQAAMKLEGLRMIAFNKILESCTIDIREGGQK